MDAMSIAFYSLGRNPQNWVFLQLAKTSAQNTQIEGGDNLRLKHFMHRTP
jgi:hypothetical protein